MRRCEAPRPLRRSPSSGSPSSGSPSSGSPSSGSPAWYEPLLAADPSFAPRWEAFAAEWRDEAESPLHLAPGELAVHLIRRLEAGDTAGFDRVFDLVERWHLDGDAYVREAATIGFLEALQNGGLHGATRPPDFERWLGPKSRPWWDRVARFWSDGTPIAPRPGP